MNILILGAGQVGSHAAQVLSVMGHNITVVDMRSERALVVEETMDVRTMVGNCAQAETLLEAGAAHMDFVIAATSNDEINILSASVAKKLGTRRAVARVHHGAYFQNRGMDYRKCFDIDELICPEFATAQAIASVVRNPGALAVEGFAKGQVQMQEVEVALGAVSDGKKLIELKLPAGMRIATVTRGDDAFVPHAQTELQAGDHAILVGNGDTIRKGVKLFEKKRTRRIKIALMGGSAVAVWLCRALHYGEYQIRLFETDRARAEELAEKLDWVTVLNADPTDLQTFEDEGLWEVDAFVGNVNDADDFNMLGCAYAKSLGVQTVVSVLNRPDYMHLVGPVGIDHVFTPRMMAMRDIFGLLDMSAMTNLASLAGGQINVYRVLAREGAAGVGVALREVKLKQNSMVAAIEHEGVASVPGANDVIQPGDTVLLIGQGTDERELSKLFTGK